MWKFKNGLSFYTKQDRAILLAFLECSGFENIYEVLKYYFDKKWNQAFAIYVACLDKKSISTTSSCVCDLYARADP